MPSAEFRFYEELNDFFSPTRRKRAFDYPFDGRPTVKDAIESLGVPHTEVDLILVNGVSVGFGHPLSNGDRVAVYPVFESLDITPLVHLRPRPLREPKFIVDTNLGKLAKTIRMLGFDTVFARDASDHAIARRAEEEHRIVLTRDVGLLKMKRVTHGLWVRSTEPAEQIREVLWRLDLWRLIRPLTRCISCNGLIAPAAKQDVLDELPPLIRECYDEFFRCPDCRKVYWQGSHYDRMLVFIDRIGNADEAG
jgi:hypothetical protein